MLYLSSKKTDRFLNNKGAVSIMLSLLVLSVLLIISLSIAFVSLQQVRISAQMGQSVVAYYAAEAGIERCLYGVWQQGEASCSYSNINLSESDAAYTASGSLVSRQISSVGQYQITSRRIEINW